MHKIRSSVILLAAVLLLLCPLSASADQATVRGSGVNVRTGPGTAFGIFASLDDGMTVEVMNRSNASWYLVSWEGNSGYVSSQYLELAEEDPTALITSERFETPGYINGMYVCMRSGPGTTYMILGTYNSGKTLTINGTSGDWVSVSVDGKDGFVYKKYVAEGSPNAAVVEEEATDVYGGSPIPQSTVNQSSGNTLIVTTPLESVPPAAVTPAPQATVNQSVSVAENPWILSSPTPSPGQSSNTTTLQVEAPSAALPSVPAAAPASSLREAEITGNAVRLRSGPGSTYSIIGTYDSGTRVTVKGVSDQWTAVIINGISGYVYSDYVRELSAVNSAFGSEATGTSDSFRFQDAAFFQVTDGFITGSSVRLREAPSMSAGIITELNFGNAVKMTGLSDGWVRVIYDGREGYVASSYVTEGIFEPAPNLSQAAGTPLGKEIAAYALNYVGSPYKWGGNSPAIGFDCSGFVQYVFSQFGYTTSRVANDVRNDGSAVEPEDLQPGDILCFYSGSNYVGHVGIYVGDQAFVHAANSATGVVVTPLSGDNYYVSRGYEIRRMT